MASERGLSRNPGTDTRLIDAAHRAEAPGSSRGDWWELIEAVLWARSRGYNWQDVGDVLGHPGEEMRRHFGDYTMDDVRRAYLELGYWTPGVVPPGQSIRDAVRPRERGTGNSGTVDS